MLNELEQFIIIILSRNCTCYSGCYSWPYGTIIYYWYSSVRRNALKQSELLSYVIATYSL